MFGPHYNPLRKMNYYRCGPCSFNLYPLDECRRCPKCQTPTASMDAPESEILSEAETRSLINKWAFKHKLDNETEAERLVRRDRALRAEQEAAARLARFPEVIEGAGFLDWEKERLIALEAKLGNRLDV